MMNTSGSTWSLDQLAKSEFFHQKLHEWKLLEVAESIETVQGETLPWNLDALGISQAAWDKVIHRGVKPVTVFAHPEVLQGIPGAIGYYRMLALVSQKSMIHIGLPTKTFESGVAPPAAHARVLASHLNKIISLLVESDQRIEPREFDLWRGMAAGAQAQGSWQNTKGARMELVLKGLVKRRLAETGLASGDADIAEILILHEASVTEQSKRDLLSNSAVVNHWFTVEDVLMNEEIKERLFSLLRI